MRRGRPTGVCQQTCTATSTSISRRTFWAVVSCGIPAYQSSAHAGDTLHSLAGVYHVPVWAMTQLNRIEKAPPLSEGERIVVPRYLGQRIASRSVSPDAAKPPSDEEPKPEAGQTEPASKRGFVVDTRCRSHVLTAKQLAQRVEGTRRSVVETICDRH